jgi:hypothetical protein
VDGLATRHLVLESKLTPGLAVFIVCCQFNLALATLVDLFEKITVFSFMLSVNYFDDLGKILCDFAFLSFVAY